MMSIKQSIKKMISNNPVANARRAKMRRELQNKDFSLLSPNCLGGILLHDLGLRFLSPTVNLMMKQDEFLQFVLHLDEYLNGDLSFFSNPEDTCPCAYLNAENLVPILITFTHYKTAEEAETKWKERVTRINKDNLFVFLEERDAISYEDLKKLGSVHARGVLAFTCNNYPDLPYCVYLEKYHKSGEVGNVLQKFLLDDSREYEHVFDFVRWFNEADGGDYNVQKFTRRR